MAIKESVTIQDVVDLLNRAAKKDLVAMRTLIETRVPCNKVLGDDPTIQVTESFEGGSRGFSVGVLGILNGIFGTDDKGWGTIAAIFGVVCEKCGNEATNGKVGEICSSTICKELGQIDDPCICGGKLVLGDLLGFEDLGKR